MIDERLEGEEQRVRRTCAMAEAESHGATLKERIVRCRDCKHYTDDEMEYYHYCGSWCEQVTPDGFCAWGERRESE